MEYRLRDDYPSTFEFHEHRERAPHLEQADHRIRINLAVKLIRRVSPTSVVDLGCGDGGLLSLIKDIPSWGYDFQPSNAEGWAERGVTASQLDWVRYPDRIEWAELAVATEILEHLADPHAAIDLIGDHCQYIVASSPFRERPGHSIPEHIWAWDELGYKQLIGRKFKVITHRKAGWSQVILGRR